MELRELKAFVAVVEAGGISAAARRLHISQPALSQTVKALERELGVKLIKRSSTGVQPTEPGAVLLAQARAILVRHDEALRAVAGYTSEDSGTIRLGIPLELAPNVLPRALAAFGADCPDTRVVPRHLSTAAQFAALRSGELDVGLVRERSAGPEVDALLVAEENLGVLLAAELGAELVGPEGIALDALRELAWVGFPRSSSPSWYDELTAILRSYGIETGHPVTDDHLPLAAVKFAAVSAGRAFALAPENWAYPIPETVSWSPLVGRPLVRRTWAVWPAGSRRRDLGRLIAAFETPDPL